MPKPRSTEPQYIRLYAVRNHYTKRLLNTLTNPRRRFWEKRGMAERAMMQYDPSHHSPQNGRPINPDSLELVELVCEVRPLKMRTPKGEKA